MGSTGPAAILFRCICIVALSSMVIVGSTAQGKTPKYVVPGETPTSALPEETPKYVVPGRTSNSTVAEETSKSAIPEEGPQYGASKGAPKFISMSALESAGNITRKKSARKLVVVETRVCPVRFDHVRGISAVANGCKDRPLPSAARCCGALKTYACPYSELINDNANNGCASDMFYVIMVRGKLRPGLFSQLCVEGPLGLQC